jgi:hypothetical protein
MSEEFGLTSGCFDICPICRSTVFDLVPSLLNHIWSYAMAVVIIFRSAGDPNFSTMHNVADVSPQKSPSISGLLGVQKLFPPLPIQALHTTYTDWSTDKSIPKSLATRHQLSLSET